MGLDTSHNAWHGSYTSFSAWRNSIADVLGWAKEERPTGSISYVIPEGRVPKQDPLPDETVTTDGETYVVRWSDSYDNSVWLGHWDEDPADVIDVLMVHADSEGTIFHRFCEPLAQRLTDIAESQDDWQREATEQFIAGLRQAALRREDVDFH